MTSIRTYDPATAGTALPELPPIPIGAVAVGAAELLQQAADLPAPTSVTLYDHDAITLQFARHKDSIRAITGWARRFGSVTTSRPGQIDSDTGAWHTTDFDYYGIAVHAFAFTPAEPASS
jgi:hypothetical protein